MYDSCYVILLWFSLTLYASHTVYSYLVLHRCNDVLELVQTTRHFRLLADTAAVGGAGSQSLDALVMEIDGRYHDAMNHFFKTVKNVLDIDGTQAFEKAFFNFRSVVKVRKSTNAALIYYVMLLFTWSWKLCFFKFHLKMSIKISLTQPTKPNFEVWKLCYLNCFCALDSVPAWGQWKHFKNEPLHLPKLIPFA